MAISDVSDFQTFAEQRQRSNRFRPLQCNGTGPFFSTCHVAVHRDRFGRGFRLAIAHYLMPDRAGDTEFQILKVNIHPAQSKQFADAKPTHGDGLKEP